MKHGEFIISLAKQTGTELTEDQTKAISEIATDLPDEISTQIQGSLFTKESALANTEIINTLKAQSLDAVDQKLQSMAMELGLDSAFVQSLKDNKGTYKGMDLLTKTVLENHKSALEKAKEGAPKGDQKELQDEIVKLNTQIASHTDDNVSKSDHQDTIDGYEEMLLDKARELLKLQSNSLFASQNWANKEVDAEVNMITGQTLFNTELITKNIKLVNDNGILKLQTQEGKPYFGSDNKEVTPKEMVHTLMAGKKLLQVTDTNTPTPVTHIIPGNGEVAPGVAAAMLKAQESMAEIAKLQGGKV